MAQNLISSGPELDWMAEASPNQSARLHFGLKRAAIAMKSIECGPSMRRLRSVFICMGADKSAISWPRSLVLSEEQSTCRRTGQTNVAK